MPTLSTTNITTATLTPVSSSGSAGGAGSVPPGILALPGGTILRGNIESLDRNGNAVLQTPKGSIALQSDLPLKTGNEVVLRLMTSSSGVKARILSVNGNTPQELRDLSAAPRGKMQVADIVENRSTPPSAAQISNAAKANGDNALAARASQAPALPAATTTTTAATTRNNPAYAPYNAKGQRLTSGAVTAPPPSNAAPTATLQPSLITALTSKPITGILLSRSESLPQLLQSFSSSISVPLTRLESGAGVNLRIIPQSFTLPATPPLTSGNLTSPTAATPLPTTNTSAIPTLTAATISQASPPIAAAATTATNPVLANPTAPPQSPSPAPQAGPGSPAPIGNAAPSANTPPPVAPTATPSSPQATATSPSAPSSALQPLAQTPPPPAASANSSAAAATPASTTTILSSNPTPPQAGTSPTTATPNTAATPQTTAPAATTPNPAPGAAAPTSAPLPTSTQNPIQAPAPPAITTTSPSIPSSITTPPPITAPSSPTQIVGQVISTLPDGDAIVKTPLGTLRLPIAAINTSLASPSAGLPIGSQFQFEVLAFQPRSDFTQNAAFTATNAASLSTGDVMQSWSGLQHAVETLAQSQPALAAQLIDSIIPKPNSKLGSSMLFFLSALRGGSLKQWTGERALEALEQAGRRDLRGKLNADFTGLRQLFTDSPSPNWQAAFIPLLDQQQWQEVRLFIKREDSANTEEASHGTRFIMEVTLSRMGEMQFDGLIRKQGSKPQFDLVLRSQYGLNAEHRAAIQQIFTGASELTGFQGGIRFQQVYPFPSQPIHEFITHSATTEA